MNIQIIDNCIENLYLDDILALKNQRHAEFQKTGIAKFTSEMETVPDAYRLLQKKLNQQITSKLIRMGHDMQSYQLTMSLLRISGSKYEGTLHHDKNANTRRKLTVILYLNAPEEGGELAFPCYDRNKNPLNNALTARLNELRDNNQYYDDDDEDDDVIDIKKVCTVEPIANRAVMIDNLDPAAWHRGMKVRKGFKMAYIAFFE